MLKDIKLSDIMDNGTANAFYEEITVTASMVSKTFDSDRFRLVYDDIVSLYKGDYPGYRACNTEYHDLKHAIDVTLATVRIAHGINEAGSRIEDHSLLILLLSAILHDTGYIQPACDDEGTGGKYTVVHVDRSIDFTRNYLQIAGYSREDIDACSLMIKATDLGVRIEEIVFPRKQWADFAKMMASADLLAQMSDRLYLEKLLFLYREFVEGKVPGFESELDLLKKTLGFYEYVLRRLDNDLGGCRRHLSLHFQERWGMPVDLYKKACDANIQYLAFLLEDHAKNYRGMLNRGSIVKKLSSIE